MRLDGFGIMVNDMAVMVRFYKDVLGFEIKEDENASNVYLEKDGTLFLLYRRTDLEPTIEPWGQRTCYIADPEGNLIEIGSFTE